MSVRQRIVLVDDHRMFREALRAVLDREPDLRVVAEAGDATALGSLVQELHVDIVVIDIGLPGVNGIEATRALLAERPAVKVIALSAYADKRYVLEMLGAGALGYVIKAAAGEELLYAIRAVARGGRYLCPEVEGAVLDTLRPVSGRLAGTDGALGRRERQVLQLIAEGCSSAQIAGRLHISIGTVDVHRRNIMRKLDLHNVAELTKYAVRAGISSI